MGQGLPEEICSVHLRLGGAASSGFLGSGGLGRYAAFAHPSLSRKASQFSRRKKHLRRVVLGDAGEKGSGVGCDQVRFDVLKAVVSLRSSGVSHSHLSTFQPDPFVTLLSFALSGLARWVTPPGPDAPDFILCAASRFFCSTAIHCQEVLRCGTGSGFCFRRMRNRMICATSAAVLSSRTSWRFPVRLGR